MYILGTSLENLEAILEVTSREAIHIGCTWSISKFFSGREKNIVPGHEVILDPSGKNPPKIGPDPSRIEKFTQMQPPKTIKELRSFFGMVNQISKYASDYTMITTKIRSLLHKNVKFCWTKDHQSEFDQV